MVIFGDDQYENFQEDLVPPFCVHIAERFATQPFLKSRGGPPRPNVWGDPYDKLLEIRGHPPAARYLTRGLFQNDFDVAYACRPLHHEGLGHAFMNTMLYLDYDRRGWDYPIIPCHVNAYGSSLVRNRGGARHLFDDSNEDVNLPAPAPRRCLALGQVVARVLRPSPWRIVLVGSSSWSRAFLTEKHHWLYPDVSADRERFEELRAGHYTRWRDLSLEALQEAGEHELLNWVPLAGAMYELGQPPAWCDFLESYLMNSCKSAALFPPQAGG